MPKKPAIAPYRGASTNSSFFATGEPFAPASSLDNVIPYDSTKDRPRMGTRPGSVEYFPGRWGSAAGSRIQGCGRVARGRTAIGNQLGTSTDLTNSDGSGHAQPAIAGNVWRFDNTWGLTAYDYENVTSGGPYSDTGGASASDKIVSKVCKSQDGVNIAIGETYTDGSGHTVARVTLRNATTLAVVWSRKLATAGQDRFISAIAIAQGWVFVCTNHFVRVYKATDGSDPSAGASTYGMNGWSSVAVDIKAAPNSRAIYVLFRGSTLGATLTGDTDGPVTVRSGVYAEHFRAGIMHFAISTPAEVTAGSPQALTQVSLSPQLAGDGSERYYEGNGTTHHGYLRFSEQMPWAPRGLRPTAFDLTPSGGFIVTHANAAWGPDGDPTHDIEHGYPADDYLAPDGSVGYYNVTAFDASGQYLWRQDGDSIRTEDGGGGFFNDLLNPTAICIDVDASGNAYTSGRRTKPDADATGLCAFAWNQFGDFTAAQDLGDDIKCVTVMPGSMNPVFGGVRSDDYTGAAAAFAHLWECRPDDLAIVRHADLGSVAVYGAIGESGDNLVFVTGKI